jgi:hypothetical protein
MDGVHALTETQMAVVKRAIVFLKSDFEYKWLCWPVYYKIARPFLWLLSLGVITKRLDRRYHGNGDDEVWPFFSCEDYKTALKSPRYLNGISRRSSRR